MQNIDKYTLLKDLFQTYPFSKDFFGDHSLKIEGKEGMTIEQVFASISEDDQELVVIELDDFVTQLGEFVEMMKGFLGEQEEKSGIEVTILAGTHKDGSLEGFDELTIKSGEIVSIVGPTGSGKSRLLADIEWAANADTPTKRVVKINGEVLNPAERYNSSNKLVAQLSQNMNFVMDLTVEEFLDLHANSRLVENKEEMIERIFEKANELAGERFQLTTPVTSLSGGQSRALMIADTAILSKSPIVLIDEIENAGIDRKKALDLLVGEDKIVLMSTHDPILALMGDRRIVINNGGIDKVVATSEEERALLARLQELDDTMQEMRNKLRYGKTLTFKEEK